MTRIGSPERIEEALEDLQLQAQTFRAAVAQAVQLEEALEALQTRMEASVEGAAQAADRSRQAATGLHEQLESAKSRVAELATAATSIRSELSTSFSQLKQGVDGDLLEHRKETERRLDGVEDFLRGRVRDVQASIEPIRSQVGALAEKIEGVLRHLEEVDAALASQRVSSEQQATALDERLAAIEQAFSDHLRAARKEHQGLRVLAWCALVAAVFAVIAGVAL